MSTVRSVSVTGIGNLKSVEDALTRAGIVAEDSADKMRASFADVGASAAKAAAATGASADEQEAAAGRAAAGWVDAQTRISRAQAAAADAARMAAAAAGESADAQVAAAARAAAAQADGADRISRAQVVAGSAARSAAAEMGLSADAQVAASQRAIASQAELEAKSVESGSRVGSVFERLGSSMSNWGIPFAASVENMGKNVDVAAEKGHGLEASLSAIGKVAWVAGGALAAGVGAEGVHAALDFQHSMATVQGSAGMSSQAVKQLGSAFLGTGFHSVFSANTMAEAYGSVAGQLRLTEGRALSAGESMKFMAAASDLAEGTQWNLKDASAALAATMQAYGIGVDHAAAASDMLFNVSRGIDAPLDAVASAVDQLHGKLGTLAPSLDDVGGLLLNIAHHGVEGTKGINVASTAMEKLISGSAQTSEVLGDLGLKTSDLFGPDGKFIGMANVVGMLGPKLDALTPRLRDFALQTLFGSRAAQTMGQVLAAGEPAYDKNAAAAAKLGTAHKAAADQADTLHAQLETLKAGLEDVEVEVGQKLIPVIDWLGNALSNSIGWLERHQAAALALAAVIGGPLAVAMGVVAVEKVGAFAGRIETAASSVGKLVSKIAGSAPQVEKDMSVIGTSGGQAGKDVETGMQDAQNAVSAAKAPLTEDAAADGAAITDGMAVAPEVEAKVGAAMAGAEADVAAAKVPMAADGAADGAAAGAGMLSGFGGVFTGVAVAAIIAKALADPSVANPAITAAGATSSEQAAVSDVTADAQKKFGSTSSAAAEAWMRAQFSQSAGRLPGKSMSAFDIARTGGTGSEFGSASMASKALALLNQQLGGAGSQTSAQAFMAALTQYGFNKSAAAGIAGNIGGQEDPNWSGATLQGGAQGPLSQAGATQGYGLAQWSTASYHAGLQALAQKMGLPASSASVQEAYLASTISPQLRTQLNAAPNPAAAAQIFESQYEQPFAATANVAGREAAATAYYGGSGYNGTSATGTGNSALQQLITGTAIPSKESSQQNTINTFTASLAQAIQKYQGVASSATGDKPLRTLADNTAALVKALEAKYEQDAKSISYNNPTALTSLQNSIKTQLAAIADTFTATSKIIADQQTKQNSVESFSTKLKDAASKYTSAQSSASSSALGACQAR